jgi:hypothetical protein
MREVKEENYCKIKSMKTTRKVRWRCKAATRQRS